MTVNFEINPTSFLSKVYSSLDDDVLKHERLIIFSGKIIYSGISIYDPVIVKKDGINIALPNSLNVIVRESESKNLGRLEQITGFTDNEIGIEHNYKLLAEIFYPPKQFDNLLKLASESSLADLRIEVSIKPGKSKISGHIGILNVSQYQKLEPVEFNTWPIEAVYFSRDCKT